MCPCNRRQPAHRCEEMEEQMPGIVVMGTQWGDEGKGKATDQMSERVDYCVR